MCDPHPAGYALAFENERLLAATKYADDPVVSAAGWDCIHDGGNATCLAFDARGLFFSIADATGRVSVALFTRIRINRSHLLQTLPGRRVVCLNWPPARSHLASASGASICCRSRGGCNRLPCMVVQQPGSVCRHRDRHPGCVGCLPRCCRTSFESPCTAARYSLAPHTT